MENDCFEPDTAFLHNSSSDFSVQHNILENLSSAGSAVLNLEPTATSTPTTEAAAITDDIQTLSLSSRGSVTDEEVKHRPAFCVFVASLAATRSDDDLCKNVRAHFDKFGHIVSVKVLRDPKNRPYAFVQYGTPEDAERALAGGHLSTLDGREIRCEAARVNRTVLVCSDRPDQRISFGLATNMSKEYGEVENMTSFDGTPGGGMFVRFAYRDDAARAFVGLQQTTNYRVYWVQNVKTPKASRDYDPKTLFVGQLSDDITEEELRNKFGKFGTILSVEIIRKAPSSDAHAFINFDSYMSTVQAIERVNHTLWKGRTVHVQNREDRKVRPQLAPPPSHIQGSKLPIFPGFNANNKSNSYKGNSYDNKRGPLKPRWKVRDAPKPKMSFMGHPQNKSAVEYAPIYYYPVQGWQIPHQQQWVPRGV